MTRFVFLSAFPGLVGSALGWKFATGSGWAAVARLVECADCLAPPAVLSALAAGVIALSTGSTGPRIRAAPSRYLVGHLATLAAFGVVTALITNGYFNSYVYEVDGRFDSSKYLTDWSLWYTIWVGLGAAALVSWVAAVAPVAGPLLSPVLAGLAVGFSAWTLGCCTRDLLWQPLSDGTLWLVDFLLCGLFPDTVCRPAEYLVGTSAFAVRIEPSCSGYEGIGLICVFLMAYLWVYRSELRFPHALLLLPLGVAVIWLSNAVRITALIAVGVWVSPDVAVDGFHSHAGWLAFTGVALGLVVLSRQVRFFTVTPPVEEAVAGSNPVAPYLVPLLVLLAVTMVTGAFTSGFDYLYPLRVVAVVAVLWYFRREYASGCWAGSWEAVGIGVAVFGLWLALEPFHTDPAAGSATGAKLANMSPYWAAAWLTFRVAGSVVTVPLAEELAFRGYLTRRLIAPDFDRVPPGQFSWTSFLISSAAFGALHGRWLAGTLAGMLYSLALYRRGRLADAVVAHATTNALLATYVLATGRWAFWM